MSLRNLAIAVVGSCLLLPTVSAAKDYRKMAAEARWLAPEEEGFVRCLAHQLKDYEVAVVRKKGDRWNATIRVSDRGKLVYSWKAHLSTVFLERDGVLYHAEFRPHVTGCAVVAYDLKRGKRLWRTTLKGVGPVEHSKYFNAVRLEPVNDDVIAVYGRETAGRYVEIVHRKTGKTVGHKRFPDRK